MFTPFEINLINIFSSTPRKSVIFNLEDLLTCLIDTETEMYSAIQSTLTKLKEMTDEDFCEQDLTLEDWQEAVELAGTLEALVDDALKALLEES